MNELAKFHNSKEKRGSKTPFARSPEAGLAPCLGGLYFFFGKWEELTLRMNANIGGDFWRGVWGLNIFWKERKK